MGEVESDDGDRPLLKPGGRDRDSQRVASMRGGDL